MTTRTRILTAFLSLAAANACAADAAPATPHSAHTVILRAARMFDGASGKLVDRPQLTIVGNKIVRIAQGDKTEVPAGAEVIDLGDATLLPGFIDAHVHLSGQMSDNWYGDFFDNMMRFPAEQALYGAYYARITLEAGFTSVRDVGSADWVALGLRNAIDAGKVPGPRMLVSNYAVGSTGGHADQDPIPPHRLPLAGPLQACATGRKNAARRCATRSSTAPTSSSSCRRAACCRCRIPSMRRSCRRTR